MRDEINMDVSPVYPFSWQAATLNAIMRGTFKPISDLLLRNDVGFAAASRLVALAGRVPFRLPVHVRVTPDEAGACPGEWVRAGEELDEGKVLLYFHGGGYFACSPATHRPITWRLSAATRRPVLAVDYRQGPVHRPAEALEGRHRRLPMSPGGRVRPRRRRLRRGLRRWPPHPGHASGAP
ncbi:alpha/beta hydrolase [Streptosporangium vulgare]|uniref:alpha/beta hydrolase n=1 Tax=Streptosporangium vulgare TaxID=46190 RepID=UPI0031DCFEA4